MSRGFSSRLTRPRNSPGSLCPQAKYFSLGHHVGNDPAGFAPRPQSPASAIAAPISPSRSIAARQAREEESARSCGGRRPPGKKAYDAGSRNGHAPRQLLPRVIGGGSTPK